MKSWFPWHTHSLHSCSIHWTVFAILLSNLRESFTCYLCLIVWGCSSLRRVGVEKERRRLLVAKEPTKYLENPADEGWTIFNHVRRSDMFPFMSRFGMAVSYVPWAWFSVLANSEGCYVPDWLAVERRRAGQRQSRKAQIKGLSPGETRNLFTQTLGKLEAVHSNYPQHCGQFQKCVCTNAYILIICCSLALGEI